MIIEFARNGEPLGSFREALVPPLVESGAIQQTDYFWHAGMPEWELVSTRWPREADDSNGSQLENVSAQRSYSEEHDRHEPSADEQWAQWREQTGNSHLPYCTNCKRHVRPQWAQRQGRGIGAALDLGDVSVLAYRPTHHTLTVCPHCGGKVLTGQQLKAATQKMKSDEVGYIVMWVVFGAIGLFFAWAFIYIAVTS